MKYMAKCFLILSLAFVTANSYVALADSHRNGPRGFDTVIKTNVFNIQKQGRDDDYVCVRGRLTGFYGKDKYEFTDENGNSIEVELDDDMDWSHISKDQLIDIEGKVDRDMFSIKIEVDYARACH